VSHLIAMLSEPRSGSSVIIQLLHCCPNVEVIDEPFHPKRVVLESHLAPRVQEQLKKHSGQSVCSPAEISKTAHSQTTLYLRAIADSSDKEFLFFKIFRTHLSKSPLYEYILRNPNVSKLVLRRNSLHTFISWKKAESLANWSHVDTTDMKIELDLEQFANFFSASTTWFDGIAQEMQRQNADLPELHYEDYARLPAWQQLQYVAEKLHSCGIEIQLPEPDKLAISLTIQDRSQSIEQKISNSESVRRDLAAGGLAHLVSN